MISYFTYYLTDFLSKFYPPGRLDLAQYGSLRHRYNKSGLRADKPVSFLSWYAEMILNSTRPWIWTEFSYFRLQLEFSSKRFYIPGMVLSQYELTLSLETGAFKYVSRARYFFVMQISLSMLVFFLRVITWNVLATVVFQLEMFLKRKKKTVSAIVELEEDVCLYEEWGNDWVGRFRVFQLPGTVEGGGQSPQCDDTNYFVGKRLDELLLGLQCLIRAGSTTAARPVIWYSSTFGKLHLAVAKITSWSSWNEYLLFKSMR